MNSATSERASGRAARASDQRERACSAGSGRERKRGRQCGRLPHQPYPSPRLLLHPRRLLVSSSIRASPPYPPAPPLRGRARVRARQVRRPARAHLHRLRFVRPPPRRLLLRHAGSAAPNRAPAHAPAEDAHPSCAPTGRPQRPPRGRRLPSAGSASAHAPAGSASARGWVLLSSRALAAGRGRYVRRIHELGAIRPVRRRSPPLLQRVGALFTCVFTASSAQMRPPAICINAQGGLLWGGQHVCLKERDGKEGAGVREEEGVEPHVISLSSTSSHHYRDFLG